MKVLLTRANNLASYAIRLRVWQNWSHGLVVVEDGMIIDSTFKLGGVRERPLHEALQHASAVHTLDIPLPNEAAAREWLQAQLNKDYDVHCIIGFAFGDRDWRDDTSWFCWELVAGAIEAGSSYRFENINRVTPRDLIRAAAAIKGQPV